MPATPKVKSRVFVENIAFRGASGLAPENTLRACDLAVRKGATIVDVNVRLSAEGIPVLFHDEDVSRRTRGKGPISSLPLREIRKLRISGGRGRRVYEEPISTLEELILLLQGRADLAIEIMGDEDDADAANAVVELIEKYELPESTTVLAHSPRVFRRLKSKRPRFRIGRVLGPRAGWPRVAETIRERPRVLMLHRGAASPKAIKMCREHKVKPWIYTVEHQKEFQRALALRPEGIMTSFPGRIRRLLEKRDSNGSKSS